MSSPSISYRLVTAAFVYLIAGLASGVYYREFTKLTNFPANQTTQLSVAHTHLLALGVLVLLVVLALEKLFTVSASRKLFSWFFWLYNLGLTLTVAMLLTHGTATVLGRELGPAISGIAGLGHLCLGTGLVCFFVALRKAVSQDSGEALQR